MANKNDELIELDLKTFVPGSYLWKVGFVETDAYARIYCFILDRRVVNDEDVLVLMLGNDYRMGFPFKHITKIEYFEH